jgi:hypothetical protein
MSGEKMNSTRHTIYTMSAATAFDISEIVRAVAFQITDFQALGRLMRVSRRCAATVGACRLEIYVAHTTTLLGTPPSMKGKTTTYVYGVCHSIADNPAVVCTDGGKLWYRNGWLHRDSGGPAEICDDGAQFWYRDGIQHRDGDLPAIVHEDGSQFWYRDGEPHRDGDQPAEIWANGTRCWYRHGLLHREGGQQAVEWASGEREWWVNGDEVECPAYFFPVISPCKSGRFRSISRTTGRVSAGIKAAGSDIYSLRLPRI